MSVGLSGGQLLRAWAALRLPGLLLLLYVFRAPVLTLSEPSGLLPIITDLVIGILSTPAMRAIVAVLLTLALVGGAMLVRHWGKGQSEYAASLAVGVALLAAVTTLTETGKRWLLLASVVLACNWSRWQPPRALLAWAPGAEALFFDRYWAWLRQRPRRAVAAPGALLAGFILALTMPSGALADGERALRNGPDVALIAEGDFNGAALDDAGERLFVVGHGVERLRAYSVHDLQAPPQEGVEPLGAAQALAYAPELGEVFVYRAQDACLLAFDAETLDLKRALPVDALAPGDPWIVHDPGTGTISLISEADAREGAAFIVVDDETGEERARRSEDPGNVVLDEERSLIYLSYFRRTRGVFAYDIAADEIIARADSDPHMERLAIDRERGEVLVAAPLEGRIWRYSAGALEPLGRVPAPFGTRVIAIDATRDQMLVGSIATGGVELIDLETHRELEDWYIGPWLRSIVLVPEDGVAFITSNGALYRLRYDDGDH